MNKAIVERLVTAVASAGVTFLAGLVLRRTWKLTTGAEPPAPEDPAVPAGKAVAWFIASGVGVGLVQLFVARYVARRRAARELTA